jgi:hypothetical protein
VRWAPTSGHPARACAALDVLAGMVTETAEGEARLARLYLAAGALAATTTRAMRALELDELLAEAWLAAGQLARAYGLDARPALVRALLLGSGEAALELTAHEVGSS